MANISVKVTGTGAADISTREKRAVRFEERRAKTDISMWKSDTLVFTDIEEEPREFFVSVDDGDVSNTRYANTNQDTNYRIVQLALLKDGTKTGKYLYSTASYAYLYQTSQWSYEYNKSAKTLTLRSLATRRGGGNRWYNQPGPFLTAKYYKLTYVV